MAVSWRTPSTWTDKGGFCTKQRDTTSVSTRNARAIEVIDHAGDSTNYAVLYKIVSIVHSINRSYSKGEVQPPSANCVTASFIPSNPTVTISSSQIISCTRAVEWWLWWKRGEETNKIKVEECTFNMTNDRIFDGSGTRAYGVSLQVNDKYILYSYLREQFNGDFGNWTPMRDTTPEMENINKHRNTGDPLWTPIKTIVGAVPLDDSKITYYCSKEDIPPKDVEVVYGIGLANAYGGITWPQED